jgi:hypothetical protein
MLEQCTARIDRAGLRVYDVGGRSEERTARQAAAKTNR